MAGLYAVALQIEDFATTTSTTPLSSVPLQFIVEVFTSTVSCASGTQPELVGVTRVDGSCVGVPSTYQERIVAKSGDSSVKLVVQQDCILSMYYSSGHINVPACIYIEAWVDLLSHSAVLISGLDNHPAMAMFISFAADFAGVGIGSVTTVTYTLI